MRMLPLLLTALAGGAAGAAQAPARLGTIHFPTSGAAAAQPLFERGVLFLHSFEYDSAAAAFREAQRRDPGFAFAYWGEAMTYTHPVWNQQDVPAARAALARLAPTPAARRAKALTPREQGYLDAIEILYGEGAKPERDTLYSAAMGRVSAAYPDDDEARAFYALSLLGLNQGVRDVPTYMRAAAEAQAVFRHNPDHPGAVHYLIHAFDDPTHAPLGLHAARAYVGIAPGAAHAQHMTTHIFLALGLWDDLVRQNEVASGHDHDRWRPGHYTTWLGYGYLQQGRYADAGALLATLSGNARTPQARGMVANLTARYVIDTERWDGPEARALGATPPGEDGYRYAIFAAGLAALRRGDKAAADAALAALAPPPGTRPVHPGEVGALVVPVILERELRAARRLADGAGDEAVALLREATALEDGMPVEFGPPAVVKPSHELLGETLLALHRPADAVEEFRRALALTPLRARALLGLGHAAAAAGDQAEAAAATAQLRAVWHRADAGLSPEETR